MWHADNLNFFFFFSKISFYLFERQTNGESQRRRSFKGCLPQTAATARTEQTNCKNGKLPWGPLAWVSGPPVPSSTASSGTLSAHRVGYRISRTKIRILVCDASIPAVLCSSWQLQLNLHFVRAYLWRETVFQWWFCEILASVKVGSDMYELHTSSMNYSMQVQVGKAMRKNGSLLDHGLVSHCFRKSYLFFSLDVYLLFLLVKFKQGTVK